MKKKKQKDVVFTGMLCLSKIVDDRVSHSEETGQDWIRIGVVLLAEPDAYGNTLIMQHRGVNGEDHVFIGNARRKGEINYKFPHKAPSKMDSRIEREETYKDFEFEDLP